MHRDALGCLAGVRFNIGVKTFCHTVRCLFDHQVQILCDGLFCGCCMGDSKGRAHSFVCSRLWKIAWRRNLFTSMIYWSKMVYPKHPDDQIPHWVSWSGCYVGVGWSSECWLGYTILDYPGAIPPLKNRVIFFPFQPYNCFLGVIKEEGIVRQFLG